MVGAPMGVGGRATMVVSRARLTDVRLDERTHLSRGVLGLDSAAVARLAAEAGGEVLAGVTLELARPGEAARIVHVLDALPALAAEDGSAFAGFLGPPRPAASGRVCTF